MSDRSAAREKLDAASDEIFDAIARCKKYEDIAHDLGVSVRLLYLWLAEDAQRSRRDTALQQAANVWLERAADALRSAREDREITPAQASVLREYATHCRWMASKFHRARFGDGPQVHVNAALDLGALHLDALRTSGHASLNPHYRPALPAPVVDADVESIDDAPVNHAPDNFRKLGRPPKSL